MYNTIKKQLIEALKKTSIEYSDIGINTNLNEWKNNKSALIEFLRDHPQWSEQEQAIIFYQDSSSNSTNMHRQPVLSVHPCDYLTMMDAYNKQWFYGKNDAIRNKVGTLSYMNDATSMIFYTVNSNTVKDFHTKPKITYQIFCYHDGKILQSRLFPYSKNMDLFLKYRELVQNAIAECLNKRILWQEKYTGINKHINTHADSIHYPDYIYPEYKSNISFSNNEDDYSGKIIVGSPAYCLNCGGEIFDAEYLNCFCCSHYVQCSACGDVILLDKSRLMLNGKYICLECVSTCEECGKFAPINKLKIAYNENDCMINVCNSCIKENYIKCDICNEYYHKNAIFNIGEYNCCNECILNAQNSNGKTYAENVTRNIK